MTAPPQKFIADANGIRHRNPEWRSGDAAAVEATGCTDAVPAMPSYAQAMPVISSIDELQSFLADTAVAATYGAFGSTPADAETASELGIAPDRVQAELGRVFAKYEIPFGLLQKLQCLGNFDRIEMLIDDGFLMGGKFIGGAPVDRGQALSPWEMVLQRLKQFVELTAYVRTPAMHLHFTNRPEQPVNLRRTQGEAPDAYVKRVFERLDDIFTKHAPKSGHTNAAEVIAESLKVHPERRVLRYFFTSTQGGMGIFPSNSASTVGGILAARSHPERNPFTILSNARPGETRGDWIKIAQQMAPVCANVAPYEREYAAIVEIHGPVFPYTYGMHLISQLVSAFDVEGLRLLHDDVPLTKPTLDSLLGYVTPFPEYDRYFYLFCVAQENKVVPPSSDTAVIVKHDAIRREHIIVWRQWGPAFYTAMRARDIPAVAQYYARLDQITRAAIEDDKLIATDEQRGGDDDASCCVLA